MTALATACTLAQLSIANAQIAAGPEPAPKVAAPARDDNGVDLVTGLYSVGSPFVIQAPAAPRLTLRNAISPGAFTHSAVPTLQETAADVGGYAYELQVTANGRQRLFYCEFYTSPNRYECTTDDGASISVSNFTYSVGDADPKEYTFIERDGSIYVFKSSFNPKFTTSMGGDHAYAFSVAYPDGEKWSFSGNRRLPDIVSNLGYKIAGRGLYKGTTLLGSTSVVETAGTPTMIVETDALSRTFTTTWSNNYCNIGAPPAPPNLALVATATTPGGTVTTLTYGWNALPPANPNIGTTRTIHNQRYVSSLNHGGQTWTYGGSWNQTAGSTTFGQGTVTVSDPGSQIKTIKSNGIGASYVNTGLGCSTFATSGVVLEVTDQLSRLTKFEYALGNDRVTKVIYPEGNGEDYAYDSRGNLLTVTRRRKTGSTDVTDGVTYQASYDATCSNAKTCNSPNWTRDAKGNQTDYTYHSHGGVKTVTLPADQNVLRQRTYYTYTAYNTGNGDIQRLTRTETCGLNAGQLGLTACPAVTDAAVATNDYGTSTTAPNTYNTFLPYSVTQTNGTGSVSVTTTYTYDTWGRVTAVDGPLAGTGDKTFTTYDVVGRKVCEIGVDPDDGGALIRAMVRHTYNNDDLETLTQSGTGTSTTDCTPGTSMTVSNFKRMTYDTLGRLTKTEVGQP